MSGYSSAEYRRNRKLVLLRDDGLCQRCLVLGYVVPGDQVDHLISLSKGGSHDMDNLMLLCGDRSQPETCHGQKSQNESHRKPILFNPVRDPNTGWTIKTKDEFGNVFDSLEYWQNHIHKKNSNFMS